MSTMCLKIVGRYRLIFITNKIGGLSQCQSDPVDQLSLDWYRYAYFVTIDESRYPVFPFVIGDTYYGTVQAGNTGPYSGHNTPSEPTTTYSGTTSVEEIPSPIAFEIEPSQHHNILYVYFSEASANNIVLDVFNTQGTLVQSMDNLQPSIGFAVDLSHVPSGVYVLRFTSTYHQISHTILKLP